MPSLTQMWQSPTSGYFDVFEEKHVTSCSENSFTENESNNGSSASFSKLNETLEKQGERTEKILELVQNQTNIFGNQLTSQGEALAKQTEALATQMQELANQGERLLKQGEVIVKVVEDQQKIKTDVARINEKLEIMEGRIEELRQGRIPAIDRGYNTRSKGKTSSSRENTKVQPSLSSVKDQVCNYCQKTFKKSYIAQHKRLWCPVRRQQQSESQGSMKP